MTKVFTKWKARTEWKIDEGIVAAPFNKWVSLNIKLESLCEMDTEGFLPMSLKQELHVKVVELDLA